MAPGNRGSFRVTPRQIDVHCEGVSRTQFGKWMDPVPLQGLDTHRSLGSRYLLILFHHWVSASLRVHVYHSRPTCPYFILRFLLTQIICFLEAHFHSPCLKPSFSFSLPIRWLTVSILPFQFSRENLNGLQNYQSHYSGELLVPGDPGR